MRSARSLLVPPLSPEFLEHSLRIPLSSPTFGPIKEDQREASGHSALNILQTAKLCPTSRSAFRKPQDILISTSFRRRGSAQTGAEYSDDHFKKSHGTFAFVAPSVAERTIAFRSRLENQCLGLPSGDKGKHFVVPRCLISGEGNNFEWFHWLFLELDGLFGR